MSTFVIESDHACHVQYLSSEVYMCVFVCAGGVFFLFFFVCKVSSA